jgi:hypothetical protein
MWMYRLVLVFCLMCLTAQPAAAGAWLREKGKGFLAYSNLTASTMDTTFSAYFDYGLSDRMTVGATLDIYTPIGNQMSGKGLLFLRRSLDWGVFDGKWAYELGVGARHTGVEFVPVAKTALSYGRGISWGKRKGWFAVDAGVEWGFGDAQHLVKIDTTVGLDIGPRSKGMLQVFSTFNDDWGTVTIAPSYIFQNKKKKGNYVIGLETSSNAPEIIAVKIGVWQSF